MLRFDSASHSPHVRLNLLAHAGIGIDGQLPYHYKNNQLSEDQEISYTNDHYHLFIYHKM